ncbi:alanine racemase [Marinisporobacter balticus]|uniref:Alanine racemase n=1 Tax=Marinisporobacter balticus TaxID=2018667 RepID=A0A4R2KFP3_9FIRM|nr:alanine racemase [Marinisporobacter balticus]TCO71057.1 alanine racemase [Marinisporobacter balticus]
MKPILRDTFVEVNLDNIIFNIKSIKKMVGGNVAIAAVVKANGYGHGAVGIAKALMENGADYLAVAALNEAMDLRKHFKEYKLFIMGFTPDSYLEHVVENDITQTVFLYRQAEILNELGMKYNKKPVVHIKYDTGFNRLGFRDCEESIDEIEKICSLKNIYVEGIFSHLALVGKKEDEKQYHKFIKAIDSLEKRGFAFKYKHIEDSISAVDYPKYRMNMIRPGAIIYGIKGFHYGSLDLKQALTFKTKIAYIKRIAKGEGVSYDYLWKAQRDSIVGTVPFGYADGYPRNLRDKGYVTIHGKCAPIIGVICMDQCMIDLTHIPEASEGDDVIIYGDGTNNTLDIHTVSRLAETNKNEIVSRITMRPPRVYTKDNKIVNVINYIG